MAFVHQPRASALPGRREALLPPSPLRRLQALAAHRPDDPALLVRTAAGDESRSWSEVEHTVLRAGAGLVRSGLRPDQVVLSLLPAAHAHPELDIALRAIGSVVIHVSPDAALGDLARQLDQVDVRLVVSETEQALDRLAGLTFTSAEMFSLDGWERLLSLGAERLLMDPDAVQRVDRMVDPDGTVARLLRPGADLTRVAVGEWPTAALPATGTTLLVGDDADPFVHQVHDAHLATGGTLVVIADAAQLPDALARVRPDALALSTAAAAALPGLVAQAPAPPTRRLRAVRASTSSAAEAQRLRAWFGGNLSLVVAAEVPESVSTIVVSAGAQVALVEAGGLLPADLPVRPPVVMGDAATLPVRARRDPGRDFQFRTDPAPQFDEPEESAFALPSLPLFGGESFLDRLLLGQADKGTA